MLNEEGLSGDPKLIEIKEKFANNSQSDHIMLVYMFNVIKPFLSIFNPKIMVTNLNRHFLSNHRPGKMLAQIINPTNFVLKTASTLAP